MQLAQSARDLCGARTHRCDTWSGARRVLLAYPQSVGVSNQPFDRMHTELSSATAAKMCAMLSDPTWEIRFYCFCNSAGNTVSHCFCRVSQPSSSHQTQQLSLAQRPGLATAFSLRRLELEMGQRSLSGRLHAVNLRLESARARRVRRGRWRGRRGQGWGWRRGASIVARFYVPRSGWRKGPDLTWHPLLYCTTTAPPVSGTVSAMFL